MIEQTKTKLQETLEFKMNKQMHVFSFSPPINLVEEGKRLLRVTSFACTNSVFKLTAKPIARQSLYQDIGKPSLLKKTIDELNKLLDLRSQNEFELHVQQVRKKVHFNK